MRLCALASGSMLWLRRKYNSNLQGPFANDFHRKWLRHVIEPQSKRIQILKSRLREVTTTDWLQFCFPEVYASNSRHTKATRRNRRSRGMRASARKFKRTCGSVVDGRWGLPSQSEPWNHFTRDFEHSSQRVSLDSGMHTRKKREPGQADARTFHRRGGTNHGGLFCTGMEESGCTLTGL